MHYHWPKDVHLPDEPKDLTTWKRRQWIKAWNEDMQVTSAGLAQGVRRDNGNFAVSQAFSGALKEWRATHPAYTQGPSAQRMPEVRRLFLTVTVAVTRGWMLDVQHYDFWSCMNPDARLFPECWVSNLTNKEFLAHMHQIHENDPTRFPLTEETVAANDSILVSALVLQLYSDHIFDHEQFSVRALLALVVTRPHDQDKMNRMDDFADKWARSQVPVVQVGQYTTAMPVGLRADLGDLVMPTAVIYRFLDAATEHFMRTEEATEKFMFLRASLRRNGHSLRVRNSETLKTTLTEGADLLRDVHATFLMCDMAIAGVEVTPESLRGRIRTTKDFVGQLQTFVRDLEQRETEELRLGGDDDEGAAGEPYASEWATALQDVYEQGGGLEARDLMKVDVPQLNLIRDYVQQSGLRRAAKYQHGGVARVVLHGSPALRANWPTSCKLFDAARSKEVEGALTLYDLFMSCGHELKLGDHLLESCTMEVVYGDWDRDMKPTKGTLHLDQYPPRPGHFANVNYQLLLTEDDRRVQVTGPPDQDMNWSLVGRPTQEAPALGTLTVFSAGEVHAASEPVQGLNFIRLFFSFGPAATDDFVVTQQSYQASVRNQIHWRERKMWIQEFGGQRKDGAPWPVEREEWSTALDPNASDEGHSQTAKKRKRSAQKAKAQAKPKKKSKQSAAEPQAKKTRKQSASTSKAKAKATPKKRKKPARQ